MMRIGDGNLREEEVAMFVEILFEFEGPPTAFRTTVEPETTQCN
jgi:hypothetical protein